MAPEWLKRHGGVVRKGYAGNAWFVDFAGQPQYRLVPVPVDGKYACDITQTINGKRIPSSSRADTAENAIAAGLGDLGKALGWEDSNP